VGQINSITELINKILIKLYNIKMTIKSSKIVEYAIEKKLSILLFNIFSILVKKIILNLNYIYIKI